jgi:hypothetical protein
MVIILEQQTRVTDEAWQQQLANLRKGQIQRHDLKTLHQLISRSDKEDFDKDP